MPLEKILQAIATLSSGLFTGAAVYINLVEHPARMKCGTRLAATEFGPSYHRASVMQASLAIIGFVAATTAWLTGSGSWWFVGGTFLICVVPFTLIVIMPTNRRLLDPNLDKQSEFANRLLKRWNRLHTVRSFSGLIAFVIFVLMR